MKLEELDMYQMSMEIGEIIWESVDRFSYFAKDTLGKQVVRSADSIAANIAEGEGAFYSGDKVRYLYYARASLFETESWLKKTSNRDLILFFFTFV